MSVGFLKHVFRVSEEDHLYHRYLAWAYGDGSMGWFAPKIQYSYCALVVTYFPWDTQVCEMKYGSWTYNGEQVKRCGMNLMGMEERGRRWVGMGVEHFLWDKQVCEMKYGSRTYNGEQVLNGGSRMIVNGVCVCVCV